VKVKVVKDHFCGTGWRAEPETLYLGGVGAVYVEKLEFELPEEWDGLAVTLHIEQEGGAVPQPMLLDPCLCNAVCKGNGIDAAGIR
jgi:hypothetical protein